VELVVRICLAFLAEALGHGKLTIAVAAYGFFCYLIAPAEHIPRFGLESKFSVQSHEFKRTIVGATGVPFIGGNAVTILNNGNQFYPAMLDDIRRARQSITMENYIFWDGKIGLQFAEAIAERGRAGVQVKLLLDAFGSLTLGKDIQRTLSESAYDCLV
jgi:cardiolipin synthase